MRSLFRFVGITMLAAMIFVAGYATGLHGATANAQGGADTEQLFQPFWEAWNLVHTSYVDIATVDDRKLMEGAISGMVNALGDRHSGYMNPALYATLTGNQSGSFGGIGATVRKDRNTGGLEIVTTMKGMPARALLKQGDIIVMVDGKDITQLTETEIIQLVRGEIGTSVKLGVIRAGERRLITIEITRARIENKTVVWAIYDGKIGYLRLNEFSNNATQQMVEAFDAMNVSSLNGLIFDLRDDPGGGLQTAIDVSSMFIKSGTVVIQRGKEGTKDIVYTASGRALAADVPLVVLINQGSASASELVSGALRDYNRAKIIGVNSFGKGSVQSWINLSDGGGLRVTIAHFFTPLDKIVHEVGIKPDILIDWTPEQQDEYPEYDPQLQEALLFFRKKF